MKDADHAERAYRVAYLAGVEAALTATDRGANYTHWRTALRQWADAPQPHLWSISSAERWQSKHCRGFSQGLAKAIETVAESLSAELRRKVGRWRDDVLTWRMKNRWRSKTNPPPPPAFNR